MSIFTVIFLFFLLASTLVQLWLSLRQKHHVSQHRAAVPEAFTGKITLAEHQKAADYTLAKGSFGRIELVLGLVVLLAWTLGGALNWLDQMWRSFGWGPLWTGTAVMLSMALISGLIDLPASLYRTFVLEEKFGFNKMTLKTMIADTLKNDDCRYLERCCIRYCYRCATDYVYPVVNGVCRFLLVVVCLGGADWVFTINDLGLSKIYFPFV